MREYTFYKSQPYEDDTPYLSTFLQLEAQDMEKVLNSSGYTIVKKWFKKEGGYDSVEITGVK